MYKPDFPTTELNCGCRHCMFKNAKVYAKMHKFDFLNPLKTIWFCYNMHFP